MMGYAKSPMRANPRAGSQKNAKRLDSRVEVAMIVNVGELLPTIEVPLVAVFANRGLSDVWLNCRWAHNKECEKIISDTCEVCW